MNKVTFNARLSEVQGELHRPIPPETCITSRDLEVAYQKGKSFLIPGRVYFYAGLAKGFCLGIITFLAIGGIAFLMGAGWPALILLGFGLAIGAAVAVEAVRQQADLVLVMPNGIFHKGWKGVKRHYWGACWGDIVGFEIGIKYNSEGSPSRRYFQVQGNIETQYSAIIAKYQTRFDPEESWTWYVRLHLKQETQESGAASFIQGGLTTHEINVTNRVSRMLPEPPISQRVAMVIYAYWKLSTGK